MSLLAAFACKKDNVEAYGIGDSAVCFESQSATFSLRGMTEETAVIAVKTVLVGPVSDSDRKFEVRVVPEKVNTAVEGKDFRVLDAVVKAGALSGVVELEVNRLEEDMPMLTTSIEIVPGENFRAGYPAYMKSSVTWSDGYVRPVYGVWRAWFTYFSKSYSRKYHEVVVAALGEEAERYVDRRTYATDELEYKLPTWWFSASRILRDYVQKYDKEHPDAPLMHSSDYEFYYSYDLGVGNGTRPENPPTILSTLTVL